MKNICVEALRESALEYSDVYVYYTYYFRIRYFNKNYARNIF